MKRVFQPRRARRLGVEMSFGQQWGARRHQRVFDTDADPDPDTDACGEGLTGGLLVHLGTLRLSGFAAYPIRVPGRCRALVTRSDARVRVGEGVLSPRWGWVFMWGRNPALTRWAII